MKENKKKSSHQSDYFLPASGWRYLYGNRWCRTE